MKKVHFTKMHGAGNDFVLIDDREETFPVQDHLRLAALATAHTGIACEGVILVQPSKVADFHMAFFNPDGTEADRGGNGARCVAAFAREIGVVRSPAMTFHTRAGLVDAEIVGPGSVNVPAPVNFIRRSPSTQFVDAAPTKLTGAPVISTFPSKEPAALIVITTVTESVVPSVHSMPGAGVMTATYVPTSVATLSPVTV